MDVDKKEIQTHDSTSLRTDFIHMSCVVLARFTYVYGKRIIIIMFDHEMLYDVEREKLTKLSAGKERKKNS